MPDSTSSPQSETSEKPKRSPTERLIVWGGIGVMVVIVGVEGMARYGYTTTLPVLQTRLQEDDKAADSQSLSLVEAEKLIAGFPSRTVENGEVIYRWKGLLKDHGAIHLAVDGEGNITGLETDAPPAVEEIVLSADTEDESPGMAEDMGAGGGGGDSGGGRNFDPMQFDLDGDGKVSLEEAPDRMKQSFDQIDANGDGFADAEEFEARRAARRSESGEGEGRRSQRPSTEESAPAEKPADSPSEPSEADSKPDPEEKSDPKEKPDPEEKSEEAPEKE